MALSLVRGKEALGLVENPDFQAQWGRLYEACPWATPYQGSEFVSTWYRAYKERYEPLIVYATDEAKGLNGLITMATEIPSGRVVVAGAHHSEYQGWIARDTERDSFMESALALIARETGTSFLSVKYVPAGTPIDWATSPGGGPWRCAWKQYARPIIRLEDASQVAEYIQRKKSRRSTKNYWNRLKRIGELRLEQIRDTQQLMPIFDRLISFYDTRQGAANNSVPFLEDPNKKPFHLSLLQPAGLLHITVLRAGDEIISAMFGVTDRKTYSLAMPMFSPIHADNSPMTLHLLMLVELLHRQGFFVLDLTPGANSFKERFASDQDSVGSLEIFFRRREWMIRRIQEGSEAIARRWLRLVGMDPKVVRQQWNRMSRAPLAAWPSVAARKLSLLIRRAKSTLELRIYAFEKESALALEDSRLMSRDRLADLLAFQPKETWQTRQSFLSESLKNIEAGHHFYTQVENGRLQHYGWLIEDQEKNLFPEVGQEFEFPAGSAVLYNFYTDPLSRGKGLYKAALRQMLRDAAQLPDVNRIYIAVMSDNKPSRHVIEKLGFRYQGSLFQSTKFGRSSRWSNFPDTGEEEVEKRKAPVPIQD
jgi:CelD/BcsL family acetyltransferase involved in cellulose biosynthesis/RimJ/RimL family protein N-acetyltransferase